MTVDEEIRARIEEFAEELVEFVKRAALETVNEALGGTAMAPAPRPRGRQRNVLAPEPAPYVLTPAPRPAATASSGTLPLSVDAYERAAYERALAECAGDIQAAGKLLGVGKSTAYRRMRFLGIDASATTSPAIVVDGPVSLDAYEKAAYQGALEQAGGSTLGAAKLLGVGKSTMYRAVAKYGLG